MITLNTSEYKSIKILFYIIIIIIIIIILHYIRMEPASQNNDINAFKEARKLLNLLPKETNEIRKKLYKKEAIYNFL